MNEEFNKDIEILKKSNWNSGNEELKSQIKTSIDFTNRLDHNEDKISGTKDKVARWIRAFR
jgi:hypothetical protein